MNTRKMEIVKITRTALFVVAFILMVRSLGYSQNTTRPSYSKDWRDYLMSYEGAFYGWDYSKTQAEKRLAAVIAHEDIFLSVYFLGEIIYVPVIMIGQLTNADGTFISKAHGRSFNQKELALLKDEVIYALDKQIQDNWRILWENYINTAEYKYLSNFTPVSPTDKKTWDIIRQFDEKIFGTASAAPNATEYHKNVYKLMTDLKVFEKIEKRFDPEEFVSALRARAFSYEEIVGIALNIDNIGRVVGWNIKNIIEYAKRFYSTPLIFDSVINEKLEELKITDLRTLDVFLEEIRIDYNKKSEHFLDTKAALARLDVIGPRLQYLQLRNERGGSSSVSAMDKTTWERWFGSSLKKVDIPPSYYFDRLSGMGFSWEHSTMILIYGQSNPDLYYNVETWKKSDIDKVKKLSGGKDSDWAELKKIFGKPVKRPTTTQRNVTIINKYEYAEKGLTSVTIPPGIITVEEGAYKKNELTTITIPNGVKTIGGEAFSQNKLTSVTIPNTVTTIEIAAFSFNRLTSIIIPNSVTVIGAGAFFHNDITRITIGANVGLNKIGTLTVFNFSFDTFYTENGSKAGTYVYSNGKWSMER